MVFVHALWADASKSSVSHSTSLATPPTNVLCVDLCAGGVIKVQRVSFQCQLCDSVVWQQPLDFLQIDAWPASLTDKVKTVVHIDLLQQWDSHRLCNPAATLSGFLNGIQHAASITLSSSAPVGQGVMLAWA